MSQNDGTGPAAAPVRARSRAPVATVAPAGANGAVRQAYTADQVFAKADEEAQRRALRQQTSSTARMTPFRFYCPIGEQRDVIVLDDTLSFYCYEHGIFNVQKRRVDVHEVCPKEQEACPLCAGAAGCKESVFYVFLSIIDWTPYSYPQTHPRAGQTIEFRKKLLAIDNRSIGFFRRQLERHGKLRGLHLLMTRDTKQTPQIGNPEFVEVLTEDQLVATFSMPAEQDMRSGDILRPANWDLQVCDYPALFVPKTGEQLRQLYGGAAVPGSRTDNAQGWGAHAPAPPPAPAPAPAATRAPRAVAAPSVAFPGETAPGFGLPPDPPPGASQGPSASPARRAPAPASQELDPDDVPFMRPEDGRLRSGLARVHGVVPALV